MRGDEFWPIPFAAASTSRNIKIPENINYNDISNIASEARQKLEIVRPNTLGQASRISGVNPSDIAVLNIYLKRIKND